MIEYLLDDLPTPGECNNTDTEVGLPVNRRLGLGVRDGPTERTSLLHRPTSGSGNKNGSLGRPTFSMGSTWASFGQDQDENDPTLAFVGLNSLEIAAVAGAKKFLSQAVVQKIVNDIWTGRIIFWESMSVNAKKKAHVLNKR